MESARTPSAVADLTNCDREPIHLAGGIQPHGGLIAFEIQTLRLAHYSANIGQWLGAEPNVGAAVSDLFDEESSLRLAEAAASVRAVVRPMRLSWRQASASDAFTAAVHVHQGVLFVEVESPEVAAQSGQNSQLGLPLQVNLANQHLQRCGDFTQLLRVAAEQVRSLTGFDRVMIYRFSSDGHGEVVGEAAKEGLESFLGLHYPATDIPQQARKLYVLNTVRGIADLTASPAPILPRCDAESQRPLDLSYCCHRAVSPVHVEYLQNMGVSASMSVSLVDDGALWGLIACHHYSPKALSFSERAASEIMGLIVANCLTAKRAEQVNRERDARRGHYHRLLETVAGAPSVWGNLDAIAADLLSALKSDGVAVCSERGVRTSGSTPPREAVERIAEAIQGRVDNDLRQWSTSQLGEELQELASNELGPSSGCLALRLSAPEMEWLLFFRDEFQREVSWAGEPSKVAAEVDGGVRLSPRNSFEEWKQVVRGHSRDWTQVDTEVASELRSGMVELLSLRAAELTRVNQELAKLNADLDSFAYAASHDLREPLRGVNQSVYLLSEELGESKTPEVERRLAALRRLAARMDELVQGLLRLSRAGRGDLEIEKVSLKEVAREAAEMVLQESERSGIEVEVVAEGEFLADFLCVRELLTNLIANAVKYNLSDEKRVEIGRLAEGGSENGATPVFFVRDNGIGVAEHMREEIFQIFRRLHLPEEFGGGSGAGLAICKKIVGRHGGRIWVESIDGQGSTFFFTLEEDR
ncbi:Phytochrome-like protein cph1 [Posidoniimonas corsicana]|uniref:histidine kinase n=1 Tax=Posidoniimonas corsicana TaxID=1938618 RepID=A0A5C5VG44_9BACT|nr:ATP-binding protein [Posidoniimonas corsicana]TWT37614.1 Phytochrome-like protein cph1 [Posidoniimonas corsicana]